MKIAGTINGNSEVLTLDTGATMNCISEAAARRLQLGKRNEQILKIKGIGNTTVPAVITMPVKLGVDEGKEIITTFAVLTDNIPTLIGRESLGLLRLVLDPANNSVSTPWGTHTCTGNSRPANKSGLKTLSQAEEKPPEEIVAKASEEWRTREVPEEAIEQLKMVLLKYQDTWHNPKAGLCTTIKLGIKVHGTPRRQKCRPIPGHLREELNRQIDDLEECKVIEKDAKCEWVSPVH